MTEFEQHCYEIGKRVVDEQRRQFAVLAQEQFIIPYSLDEAENDKRECLKELFERCAEPSLEDMKNCDAERNKQVARVCAVRADKCLNNSVQYLRIARVFLDGVPDGTGPIMRKAVNEILEKFKAAEEACKQISPTPGGDGK